MFGMRLLCIILEFQFVFVLVNTNVMNNRVNSTEESHKQNTDLSVKSCDIN